jgi:lipoic acid synthetase
MIFKPKVKAPNPQLIQTTTKILQQNHTITVCEASACPNRVECYMQKSATFMILGDVCTRACRFCNIKTGKPKYYDSNEANNIANAVYELGLDYVVITSVDRDDLDDLGCSAFLKTVMAIKHKNPNTKIELLTPDFQANKSVLRQIVSCGAYKLAHNQETVRRLSPKIRPQSDYEISLKTLRYYSKYFSGDIKSSLMIGLGERESEIIETMYDLLDVGVTQLTIGQYLQPTVKHYKVYRYYSNDYFKKLKDIALSIGFKSVASGILVRSSYYAKNL